MKREEEPESKIIWENWGRKIHPALDFKDGVCYVSQYLPCQRGEDETELCTVITSDRRCFILDRKYKEANFGYLPNKIDARWSMDSINRFLNNNEIRPDFKTVFEEIRTLLLKYMDFTDIRHADLVSLWLIGTYFHPLFDTYPFLFLNAPKRSGKTRLLTLAYLLSFNCKFLTNLTQSTFFRLVQDNRCTLAIDEIEQINRKELAGLRELLLGSYKKGIKVARAAEKKKNDVKKYVVEEYDLFSPKIIANISGVEDVLEDRCITLLLQRTTNKKIGNTNLNINHPVFQKIRDELYMLLLLNCNMVDKVYRILLNEVDFNQKRDVCDVCDVVTDDMLFSSSYNTVSYNNIVNTVPSLLCDTKDTNVTFATKQEQEEINELERYEIAARLSNNTIIKITEKITSRYFELWSPIFAIAASIDSKLFDNIVDFAVENTAQKEETDISENQDVSLLMTLANYILMDDWYPVSAITNAFREGYAETLDIESEKPKKKYPDWVNSWWVSKSLRRMGVILHSRRKHSGREVYIMVARVKEQAKRYGIEPTQEEQNPITKFTQPKTDEEVKEDDKK